jgi:hypothetical protein
MVLGIQAYCWGNLDAFSSPVNQSHQTSPCKGAEQLHTSTACRAAGELWGGEGQGFFLTRQSSRTGRIAEEPVKPAAGWGTISLCTAQGLCTDLYTHSTRPGNSIIRTLQPLRKQKATERKIT